MADRASKFHQWRHFNRDRGGTPGGSTCVTESHCCCWCDCSRGTCLTSYSSIVLIYLLTFDARAEDSRHLIFVFPKIILCYVLVVVVNKGINRPICFCLSHIIASCYIRIQHRIFTYQTCLYLCFLSLGFSSWTFSAIFSPQHFFTPTIFSHTIFSTFFILLM